MKSRRSSEDQQPLLSIGQVAAETGLRPSALRYYEDVGLIRSAARVAGRRHYAPSTLGRLSLIALCQQVGFTVAEIAELLGEQRAGRERWNTLAQRKLDELDEQIRRAKETRRLLTEALACDCEEPGDLATCGILAAAAERRTRP